MGFLGGAGTPLATPRMSMTGGAGLMTPRGSGGVMVAAASSGIMTPRSGTSVSAVMGMFTPRGSPTAFFSAAAGKIYGAVSTAVTSGSTPLSTPRGGGGGPRASCALHNLPICSSSGFNHYLRTAFVIEKPAKEPAKKEKPKKKLTLRTLVKLQMMFRPEIRFYFRLQGYDAGPIFQGRVSAREGELRTVGDVFRVLRRKMERNVDAYFRTLSDLFPFETSAGRSVYCILSAKCLEIEDEDGGYDLVEDDEEEQAPGSSAAAGNMKMRASSSPSASPGNSDSEGPSYFTSNDSQLLANIRVSVPTLKLFYMVSPNDIAHFDLYAYIPRAGKRPYKMLLQRMTYYPWNKQVKKFGCDMLPHPPGSRKILFETPKPESKSDPRKRNIVVKLVLESDWAELQKLMQFLFDQHVAKHQKKLKESMKTFAETYFQEKLEREAGVTKELLGVSQKVLENDCRGVALQLEETVKSDLNEDIRKLLELYIKSKQEMLWDVVWK